MIQAWKRFYEKVCIKEVDDPYVRARMCENNRKLIVILCSICVGIFSVLIALGALRIGVNTKDVPVFAGALLYAIGVWLLLRLSDKKNYVTNMIATYLTMGAVVFYGLLISYRAPEQYTVTFIAMMGIMSMTFVDKPIRIGIAHIFVTVLCIGMICMHKADSVRIADLINVVSFSVLSFIGGFYTVKMKVHGYVVDQMLEDDIEQGRRRLNAKEMEALLLLTAVKSTYDMIVCVNLTRNTYKLIGDESFVTQGDDVEGNFDEVIDIHAAKVVPEHRQRYFDTFSRKGLLQAHAQGKREVYLEYQQCDEWGMPHWLATHTMFIDDPHSDDVTEITISQNVDERVRKEEEIKAILQQERDKAEHAQKAKTEFLFQMSHDIRTPMNAILGFANFIKSSNDLYTIKNEYVVNLETAGQQLLMLINDALEMSRIESGKLVFRREVQDLRTTIMNVLSVMQLQAEEKGLTLATDFSVTHPIVNCDQNHMNRVVMNLVSNAVKFTPAGGRVTVSLHELPEAPEGFTCFDLKVIDTGIGMSADFLTKVFEPFEREQTSTVSGMQGTGLGLTIVKRIVETAGDTIRVESEQGVGTTFTLHLTLRRVDVPLDQAGDSFGSEHLTTDHMTSCFKGKRLLLVEDNEFNLIIAKTLLENAGFAVETAADGCSAVNKVKHAPTPSYYDAILMDIQMPVMNGYEATKAIRALPDERAETVIIAVTANAFDTDKADAEAAGMNGHLAKPIDVPALYRTLWDILHDR